MVLWRLTHGLKPQNSVTDTRLRACWIILFLPSSYPETENVTCGPDPLTTCPKALKLLLISLGLLVVTSLLPTWKVNRTITWVLYQGWELSFCIFNPGSLVRQQISLRSLRCMLGILFPSEAHLLWLWPSRFSSQKQAWCRTWSCLALPTPPCQVNHHPLYSLVALAEPLASFPGHVACEAVRGDVPAILGRLPLSLYLLSLVQPGGTRTGNPLCHTSYLLRSLSQGRQGVIPVVCLSIIPRYSSTYWPPLRAVALREGVPLPVPQRSHCWVLLSEQLTPGWQHVLTEVFLGSWVSSGRFCWVDSRAPWLSCVEAWLPLLLALQVISLAVIQAVGSWWLSHLLLSFLQFENLPCAPHESVSLKIMPAPQLLFLAVLGVRIINTSAISFSLDEKYRLTGNHQLSYRDLS